MGIVAGTRNRTREDGHRRHTDFHKDLGSLYDGQERQGWATLLGGRGVMSEGGW